MKFNRNLCIFIQENAFENVVCDMASISSRPQCVKKNISLANNNISNGFELIQMATLPHYCYICDMWMLHSDWFLTHWGRDKMDAIFQTTFSNGYSWMKMYEFRIKFHWSLFLRFPLTISQHWFRSWLDADQATSHYLNLWWWNHWRIYASLGLNELIYWQDFMWWFYHLYQYGSLSRSFLHSYAQEKLFYC